MALYRGLRPTLWRDVPFSAIYWLSVEQCRSLWPTCRNRTTHSSSNNNKNFVLHPLTPLEEAGQEFVNGAVSGMLAAACTTPFDVVKTRQQVTSMATPAVEIVESGCSAQLGWAGADCKHNGAIVYDFPHKPPAETQRGVGTFQLLREIAAQEGVAGLWRGNQARMLKVAPGCAIMISSYEFGKRILE